ncbi:MAG: alpha-ketoacid dehydrogenase subunit beta [Proteobacteria bacterium]|nr:alpha-ketoacid dehydrogenase subunit beta [Burkholderiales bacterium]
MAVMTYAQAAQLALRQEMQRDPRVWALGEDLGPEGGVAGQYLDLQREFGRDRIVDTPISESTIMGSAIGAAICGTRPVVELRYADFGLCAADEIVNQAAKARYMLGGQVRVPVVIRQQIGFRDGMAAQHSQSTEAWWVHIPGLVVVAPATPSDSHELLKAAIRCDDPVIYMEHKELWTTSGEVDTAVEPAPLGRALVRRHGTDLTLVTWSGMLPDCLAAAETLSARGVQVEVIDLRTLWPWDRDTVFGSVARTGRLLVVHQAVRIGGFGAELVAETTECLFGDLDCAPRRLGAPRTPVPYSQPLEALCRVSEAQIVATVLAMVGAAASTGHR